MVNIGSVDGLSPVWHQTITWINADLKSKSIFLFQENAFEDAACKLSAIFFISCQGIEIITSAQ